MKKIVFVVVVVGLLLIINGLIASIFDLLGKQDLVKSAQRKLEIEKAQNAKLKAEYSLSQQPNFIEEQARNELFLSKPGEEELIIPNNLLPTDEIPKTLKVDPFWKQWLDLFL